MGTVTVYTRQHRAVLAQLEQEGRYVARRGAVLASSEAPLMQEAYDWLQGHLPQAGRSADADYPIWLALQHDGATLPVAETVLLTLELDEALITRVNVAKWGAILNASYLPADERDARRHKRLLQDLGISDAKACLSRFYPEVKAEIRESWMRLFDESVQLGSDLAYGLIWELKREWLRSVSE